MRNISMPLILLLLSMSCGFSYGLIWDPGPDLITPEFFQRYKKACEKSTSTESYLIPFCIIGGNYREIIGFQRFRKDHDLTKHLVVTKSTRKTHYWVESTWYKNFLNRECIKVRQEKRLVSIRKLNRILNKHFFAAPFSGPELKKRILGSIANSLKE